MTAALGSIGFALRPERPGDTGFRAILHVEANAALFAGLPGDLRDMILCQQLAAQAAGYRAQFPAARYEIVEVDGVPIGRIVTTSGAAESRVVDIALRAAWRGRGIGTMLLRRVMEEAAPLGVPVRLEVATMNTDARRLYERHGFRCVARTEVALGMEWRPS